MCLSRWKQNRFPESHVAGQNLDDGQLDDMDAHEGVRCACLTFHLLETLEMAKDTTDDRMLVTQVLFGLVGIGGWAHWFATGPDEGFVQAPDEPITSLSSITVEKPLSSNSQFGNAAFDARCSASDGVNVSSWRMSPICWISMATGCRTTVMCPFNGHWHSEFGNVAGRLWGMSAVKVVTLGGVAMNVAHVRKLRQVSGIN